MTNVTNNQTWSVAREIEAVEDVAKLFDLSTEMLTKQLCDPSISDSVRDGIDRLIGRVKVAYMLFGSKNEYLRCYLSALRLRYWGFDAHNKPLSAKDRQRIEDACEVLRDKKEI